MKKLSEIKFIVHKIWGGKLLAIVPDLKLTEETGSLYSMHLTKEQFEAINKSFGFLLERDLNLNE